MLTDRRDLLAASRLAARAASRRSGLPVLRGLRLAWDGETLSVSATDLSSSVRAELGGLGGGEPWARVLGARELTAVLRSADGRMVELLPAAGGLLIGGLGVVLAELGPAEDWPAEPTGRRTIAVLGTAELAEIAAVAVAAATDETRPLLCGVRLEPLGADETAAVATDSYRMFGSRLPVRLRLADGETGVLLPSRLISLASRLRLPEHATAELRTLTVAGRPALELAVSVGGVLYEFAAELADGEYPSWRQLLPTPDQLADRAELAGELAEIARALELAERSVPDAPAVLAVSPDGGELGARDAVGGRYYVRLGVRSRTEVAIATGWNPRYLRSAILHAADGSLWVHPDSLHPAYVGSEPTADGVPFGRWALVMPVRLPTPAADVLAELRPSSELAVATMRR